MHRVSIVCFTCKSKSLLWRHFAVLVNILRYFWYQPSSPHLTIPTNPPSYFYLTSLKLQKLSEPMNVGFDNVNLYLTYHPLVGRKNKPVRAWKELSSESLRFLFHKFLIVLRLFSFLSNFSLFFPDLCCISLWGNPTLILQVQLTHIFLLSFLM